MGVCACTQAMHDPRGTEGSELSWCPRRNVFLLDQARERRESEQMGEAGAAAGPVMRGLLAPAAREQQHCESDVLHHVRVDDVCVPSIV